MNETPNDDNEIEPSKKPNPTNEDIEDAIKNAHLYNEVGLTDAFEDTVHDIGKIIGNRFGTGPKSPDDINSTELAWIHAGRSPFANLSVDEAVEYWTLRDQLSEGTESLPENSNLDKMRNRLQKRFNFLQRKMSHKLFADTPPDPNEYQN